MAKTERLRRSFFPQAIRLLNTNPVSKHLQDSLLTVKLHILITRIAALCTYPVQPVAHPSCTSLLIILLFIKSQYTVFAHLIVLHFYSIAHFTLIYLFYHIYALVLCYFYIIFICILLHCPLSGPDLIYISLLIIPCIIYYVTNKETLTLYFPKIAIYIYISGILLSWETMEYLRLSQSVVELHCLLWLNSPI